MLIRKNKLNFDFRFFKSNKMEENNSYNDKDNSKIDYINDIDEKKKVIYEPDKMWFDYQSLLDKTKNVILQQDDEIKVKNNVDKNELAKKVLSFGNNGSIIGKALDGKIWAQSRLMYCIEKYGEQNYSRNEEVPNDKNYKEIEFNYRHLLGIVASLAQIGNEIAKKRYLALVKYIPEDFYSCDISNINYFNIMHPILQDN